MVSISEGGGGGLGRHGGTSAGGGGGGGGGGLNRLRCGSVSSAGGGGNGGVGGGGLLKPCLGGGVGALVGGTGLFVMQLNMSDRDLVMSFAAVIRPPEFLLIFFTVLGEILISMLSSKSSLFR